MWVLIFYKNINEIQEKLQNIDFVKNVRWISKEETFEKFKNLLMHTKQKALKW